MPSPFPGMDPYLEEPGLWPDVHARLIAVASEFLGQSLRPKYYVRIEQLEAISLIEEEIHESYIEIVDRVERLVITVIEILSPTNKVASSRGRKSYETKREEVMKSPSHLVEIDLLRRGEPIPIYGGIPPHEYLVHVSRADRRPKATLWPIRLSQHLPPIAVPLKPEDGSVDLDLQAVLDASYDRAGYDLEIDYGVDAVPPLEGEWNTWAHRLLLEKGLRAG
jgi:Protein of unknown function (DUF4058)